MHFNEDMVSGYEKHVTDCSCIGTQAVAACDLSNCSLHLVHATPPLCADADATG